MYTVSRSLTIVTVIAVTDSTFTTSEPFSIAHCRQLSKNYKWWHRATLLGHQQLRFLFFCPQVEPGVFRELHNFMQDTTNRHGRIEVLSFAVTSEAAAGSEDFNTISPADEQPAAAAAAVVGQPTTPSVVSPSRRPAAASRQQREDSVAASAAASNVVYKRGAIEGLPEEFASRKERFVELDQLQSGWQVELISRGETVDAVFYDPEGKKVGTFAAARRQALAAHKAALQL